MNAALAEQFIQAWMGSIQRNATLDNLLKLESRVKARIPSVHVSYIVANNAVREHPHRSNSRKAAATERKDAQHRLLVLVPAGRLARAAICQLMTGAKPTAAAYLAKHLLQFALRLPDEADLLDPDFSLQRTFCRDAGCSIVSAAEAQSLLSTELTAPPEGAFALLDPELNPRNQSLSERVYDYQLGVEIRKTQALREKIIASGILEPEEEIRLRRFLL